MFAPAVLPLQLTFFVVLGLMTSIFLLLKRKPERGFLSCSLIMTATGILAFIPVLICVGFVVDSYRYGEFHFSQATQINDPYVRMPNSATNITLHKYASYHAVKFTANSDALLSWMTELAEHRRTYAADSRPFEINRSLGPLDFARRFAKYHWSAPEDIVCYEGWYSRRGAGFDVWYSPTTTTGYILATYW